MIDLTKIKKHSETTYTFMNGDEAIWLEYFMKQQGVTDYDIRGGSNLENIMPKSVAVPVIYIYPDDKSCGPTIPEDRCVVISHMDPEELKQAAEAIFCNKDPDMKAERERAEKEEDDRTRAYEEKFHVREEWEEQEGLEKSDEPDGPDESDELEELEELEEWEGWE